VYAELLFMHVLGMKIKPWSERSIFVGG